MYENWKVRLVPISGLGREKIKANDRRYEFNYDIL
jgi:hypothetical protein